MKQRKATAKPDPMRYCGIVFIGSGSSWAYAPTMQEAAETAAKQCKRDWSSLYKFKRKHDFTVSVYDMGNHEGWYADYRGVFDRDTKEQIPMLEKINVVV